jgi:hypothetical protein
MKAWSAILFVILLSGCAKKREPAPTEHAPANEAAGPEVTIAPPPAAPLFERHEGPTLAPAEVPVEEDFIAEAEERIGKRSNLELELARLAKEIRSDSE